MNLLCNHISAQRRRNLREFSIPRSFPSTFRLPRPKGHYGTGRNAGLLKPSAPWYPAGRPDLDKLLRSTLDALGEAGIWGDDAQVVTIAASKHYTSDYEPPGATIRVATLVNTVESQVT